MEDKLTRWVALGLAVVIILAGVGMMNKPEQTRPLSYDKGVYSGQPDTALDNTTRNTLKHRTDRYRNLGL